MTESIQNLSASSTAVQNSDITWIGTIPSDWKINRIKHTCSLRGRIGWQGLKSSEFISQGPFVITGTDFDNGHINWDSCNHISDDRYNEDPAIHVKEGDLLITKDGTIGKVAIASNVPEKVSLNSGVMLIRPYVDIDVNYLRYVLTSDQFSAWYESTQRGNSTIKHLYQEQFYNFQFTEPPLEVQNIISKHLDKVCKSIDGVITAYNQQLELLKNLKQSIIIEAVTKGLDQNISMVDSEIPWVGQIPLNSKIIRFRYLSTIETGNMDTQDMDPLGEYPFFVRSPIVQTSANYSFDTEAILMAGDGVGAGKVFHYYNGKFGCHQRVYCFHTFAKCIEPKFIMYYMQAMFKFTVEESNAKSTVDSIRLPMLKDFPIVVHTKDTQIRITQYLDKMSEKIDNIILEFNNSIELLNEYKKSIIYEYVTGKLTVQEKN